MPLYLGLDSSTQSLTAIVIDVEPDHRRIVHTDSLNFDSELPHYGTAHGVLPSGDPAVAAAPPLMWGEALDRLMARLANADLEWRRLAAIAGSGQQHGSVYLNARATGVLGSLDAGAPLVDQLRPAFSRAASPIWMDTSTAAQCAEITAALGGAEALGRRTGSRAFERFTGPQIRKFWQQSPAEYAATDRIHLVSSFMASLLAGRHAPLDPGDGSGMNLMDLATRQWWPDALDATAPGLAARLPAIVESSCTIGVLAPYWQRRYGFPAARVVAWSGDNPCSLIGTGLVRSRTLAVSLGTSDTVFGAMDEPRVDRAGDGHVFGAPNGRYMGLVCFLNGSLARERVRDEFTLDWSGFAGALDQTPPGNRGRLLLPWFAPEITPTVAAPGVRRFGVPEGDAAANVRGVVEAQQLAARLHSKWIAPQVDAIYATGGAAANRAIVQVMADVFGADVYQFEAGNSAALGAALRALHADWLARDGGTDWSEVVRGFAEPIAGSRVAPDPERHQMYERLSEAYAACEAFALGTGPSPEPLLQRVPRFA
jgi:xylulokinase